MIIKCSNLPTSLNKYFVSKISSLLIPSVTKSGKPTAIRSIKVPWPIVFLTSSKSFSFLMKYSSKYPDWYLKAKSYLLLAQPLFALVSTKFDFYSDRSNCKLYLIIVKEYQSVHDYSRNNLKISIFSSSSIISNLERSFSKTTIHWHGLTFLPSNFSSTNLSANFFKLCFSFPFLCWLSSNFSKIRVFVYIWYKK